MPLTLAQIQSYGWTSNTLKTLCFITLVGSDMKVNDIDEQDIRINKIIANIVMVNLMVHTLTLVHIYLETTYLFPNAGNRCTGPLSIFVTLRNDHYRNHQITNILMIILFGSRTVNNMKICICRKKLCGHFVS